MANIRNILRFTIPRRYLSTEKSNKKPIIVCKRSTFDHYVGQTYKKFDGIPLASQGWLHTKSKNDYFTIFGDANKAAEPEERLPGKSFEDIGLAAEFVEVLSEQGILTPTAIQAKAIPSILAGHNTMLTAETGCGKTLAYLLPLMQNIKVWKDDAGPDNFNSPLAVVITPSRELAIQIGEVAQRLVEHFNIDVTTLVGGKTKQKMLNPPIEYCDLLVTTLGAFSKLVTTGIYKIQNVHHIVLDEADTLLDDSFSDKLAHLLKKFPIHFKRDTEKVPPLGCQLTMASATMPVELPSKVSTFVDPESVKTVSTKNIHRLLPHVPQKFLRLGKAQKPLELLQLVKADVNLRKPVMIFSNQTATCDWVSMFLNENNIECININGRMAVPLKLGKFESFKNGEVNVLSCTDIASRGLDTTRVQHILNYDFPLYTADYIHRCGRTGRLGSPADCRVTNFIAWPREIQIVQKIELSVRKDGELPSVNANIRRLIQNRMTNFVNKEIRAYS